MARKEETWDLVKTERCEDEDGKHKKVYHRGGLVTDIVEKPSQHYVENKIKPLQETMGREAKERERKIKVAKKMEEIAERELEKEELEKK